MKKKYIVGVDVGGTKIATILMNANGKIIKKVKFATEAEKSKTQVLNKIVKSIYQVIANKDMNGIVGIGIGLPGIIDRKKGLALRLPNLPRLKNIPLKKIIERQFKLKTIIENDSACMALGENIFGHGKKVKNLICLTLGTGVGGGIIIDNKIYYGRGNAGEPGHITIEKNGIKCNCGNHGCLEEYISARAIKREAKKYKIKEKNIIKIEKLAKKGNKKALSVYKEIGTYLGIGLTSIVNLLDPELILLGGGISKSGNLILKPAIKELRKRTFFRLAEVKIVKLGDYAGAIGAACLWLR